MNITKLLGRFLIWKGKHLKHRQFVFILSFVIGIISGIIAVILKNTVYYTNEFLTHKLDIENINLLYLAYPLIGITLTVLFVKIFIKDNIGHGISRILYAISKRNSNIKSHNNFSSFIF